MLGQCWEECLESPAINQFKITTNGNKWWQMIENKKNSNLIVQLVEILTDYILYWYA